ncbi:MAG: serine hydrolase [Gammaproteobacteria bacterium]|nr:serine hydrolase [Gammaproteobacteria bacterium]
MPKLLIAIAVCLCAASCGKTATEQPLATPQHEQNMDPPMATTRELPHGSPEEVGMSAEGLRKIDDVVQEYIDAGRIRGAVVGVTRRNKVVYMEAHGALDDTTERPMRKDAMFHMASSTKPVLGVAAMMMIEEGLISPEDPVEKYIPEFKGIQVAVAKESADKDIVKSKEESKKQKLPDHRLVDVNRPVTVHDLLTHTAGLHAGGIGNMASKLDRPGASDTLASWIPKVAAGPLDFQPGTRWAYSGTVGLDVVARIVEIVSGTPFNEFVQTRIFDPLDMKDTHWNVPKDKQERMPAFSNDKGPWIKSPDYYSGSIGLVSTARDYMHFEQMLVNKGALFGHRLLKPESVAMMSTNRVENLFNETEKGGSGRGFGYTVAITVDPEQAKDGRTAGAFGWMGAAGTVSWTAPEEELTVVYMVQGPTELPWRIAELVRDAIVD